jgi:CRP-like cAMP-binding protein
VSIENLVAPWLKRWGIADAAPLADWLAGMQPVALAGDDHLVRAGERSNAIYLIQRGLLRLYYTDAEGRERNKAFYGDGDITGPVSAIMTDHPASFAIQALEPCEVLAVDLQQLLSLAPSEPEVSRLVITLLSEAFMRNEQREMLLLTCNAEQRYRWMLDHQPELMARIPQYHIAAYLGIDAVSLSRIKRKIKIKSASSPPETH